MVLDKTCLAPYIGDNDTLGLVKGNIYSVVIKQKKHGFELSVYYDATRGHDFVKECIPYSNENSLKKYWDV